MTDNEILRELVDKYRGQQLIVAIEELSELQKELTKSLRDKGNIDHIIEEIADVEVMIEQIKIFYDISNREIEKVKHEKIVRTKERVL